VKKALTSLYGISSTSRTCYVRAPAAIADANKPAPAQHNVLSRLMAQHYIHPTATLGSLATSQLTALTASLTELTIENDLRRKIQEDIRRMRDMGSYRGRRHAMGLPVRGQRTRTQVRLSCVQEAAVESFQGFMVHALYMISTDLFPDSHGKEVKQT